MSDDVAINTDDGRVFFSHPGETVGGQLIDLAGKVDGATLAHCQIHHLGEAQTTEVRTLVKPRMLSYEKKSGKTF